MQFLLRKPYTSTMLLVFYAIFHQKTFMQFLLRRSYTSTMLLVFYAVFIKETLYKYNVISVLCYFSSQGQKKIFTVKKNFFKGKVP